MSYKKYLYIYAAFVLLMTVLLSAFNYIVDPYLLFGTERIAGFNDKKPASINRTQLFKPYEVLRVRPKTIIVGNSRPEMGINPESSCWQDPQKTVYSLTFPGTSTYGQIRALTHGLETGTVKHVVLGLDFIDFLYTRSKDANDALWPARHSDFLDRLLVNENQQRNTDYTLFKIKDYFKVLFSLDALTDGLYTVIKQTPASPDRTPLGFNPAADYNEITRYEGEWVLFSQKLSELKKRFAQPGMSVFDTPQGWSVELEGLKRVIEYTQKHDIQLTLFINPYHYSYLEVIRDSGYWHQFEDFKRGLKNVVDRYGKNNIRLWDFSLYSAYTVSPIPRKGGKVGSKWFWEPSHYKSTLGDIMLAEMFGTNCLSENQNPLGRRLNRIDIDAYLRSQQSQRIALITQMSQDI
ncbi:MAG: hypothetical protein ACU84J_00725 [Gammaproteobacteria bacterium]